MGQYKILKFWSPLGPQLGLLGAGAGKPVLNEGFNYPFHQPSRQGQGTAATFISQSPRVAPASATCTDVMSALLLAAASPLSPLKRRLNFSFQLPGVFSFQGWSPSFPGRSGRVLSEDCHGLEETDSEYSLSYGITNSKKTTSL